MNSDVFVLSLVVLLAWACVYVNSLPSFDILNRSLGNLMKLPSYRRDGLKLVQNNMGIIVDWLFSCKYFDNSCSTRRPLSAWFWCHFSKFCMLAPIYVEAVCSYVFDSGTVVALVFPIFLSRERSVSDESCLWTTYQQWQQHYMLSISCILPSFFVSMAQPRVKYHMHKLRRFVRCVHPLYEHGRLCLLLLLIFS